MSKEERYNIYIVLTHTGTTLSRIIKLYTGAEFSHVSIALDKDLNQMYSFGRLNPYNPFIGGFVHEKINYGTYKRFKNTYAAVYSFRVTERQYEKINKIILKMYKNKENYKFNILGLLANGFHIKYKKNNCFYCAEFIKFLIDEADVELDLPTLIRPNDFKYVYNLNLIYEGILNKYSLTS